MAAAFVSMLMVVMPAAATAAVPMLAPPTSRGAVVSTTLPILRLDARPTSLPESPKLGTIGNDKDAGAMPPVAMKFSLVRGRPPLEPILGRRRRRGGHLALLLARGARPGLAKNNLLVPVALPLSMLPLPAVSVSKGVGIERQGGTVPIGRCRWSWRIRTAVGLCICIGLGVRPPLHDQIPLAVPLPTPELPGVIQPRGGPLPSPAVVAAGDGSGPPRG